MNHVMHVMNHVMMHVVTHVMFTAFGLCGDSFGAIRRRLRIRRRRFSLGG
jgi:hypothetical protein